MIAGGDPAKPRRYHRLFRAFLVSSFRASDQARFRELNEKAARISEANHRWDDAVYHYIQEAAWDSIIQITDRVGSRMFEEGNWATLGDWLDAVPDEELASRPRLMIWKARVLHRLRQTDRALALLAQCPSTLLEAMKLGHAGLKRSSRGVCLRLKGEYTLSRETLEKARALLANTTALKTLLIERAASAASRSTRRRRQRAPSKELYRRSSCTRQTATDTAWPSPCTNCPPRSSSVGVSPPPSCTWNASESCGPSWTTRTSWR